MRRWLVPACLVLAVDLLVLAGVARNRSGEPEAMVELTERELALPWWSDRVGRHEENTGLSLRLDHQPQYWNREDLSWFDEGVLRELGFNVSYPADGPDAEARYRRTPPRRAFVALEMDGPAWQEMITRRERDPETTLEEIRRIRGDGSRLVVVAAGLDPKALRARFPDRSRYLILAAEVGLSRLAAPDEPSVLRGNVPRLLISNLHVPSRHRALFDQVLSEAQARRELPLPLEVHGPRYAVTVKVGRRLEPWIDAVRPLFY